MSCSSIYCNLIIQVSTGLSYISGDFVLLYCDNCNYINGQVISYNPTTGELVLQPIIYVY